MSTASTSSAASGIKRKRGRPPTTGEYVGRAAAMEEAARREREVMELRAEHELTEMASEARVTRAKSGSPSLLAFATATPFQSDRKTGDSQTGEEDPEDMGPRALQRRVLEDLNIVTNVAAKSSNLKGNFVRALREAASSIAGAVEKLAYRSRDDELDRLEKSNEALRKTNKDLKKEMGDLRKEVEEMRETLGELKRKPRRPQSLLSPSRSAQVMDISDDGDPPPQEPRRLSPAATKSAIKPTKPLPAELDGLASNDFMDKLACIVLRQVGGMVDARMAALEERLLPEKTIRPPIQARDHAAQQQQQKPQQPPITAGSKRLEKEKALRLQATNARQQQQQRRQPKRTQSYAAVTADGNLTRREPLDLVVFRSHD